MNVLITGGAGFVGRHFVKRLLREGCHVTVVDNLSATGSLRPKEQPYLIFQNIDVRTYFRHTPHCEFDLVIHLAAVVGGRLKIEGDPLAVATDLSIDAEFFQWLAKVPKKPQVIYFSSSAAYPIDLQKRDSHRPLREEYIDLGFSVSAPDMTYGWAKLTGEYLAKFAAEKYGVDVKVYRPFSGYGPDQSSDYPFPSVVGRVMNCQRFSHGEKSKRPVTVWGSGDQLRDFIHIDDVVDAVLETKDKIKPADPLNLGSGVGVSFRELAHRTAALMGRTIDVQNDLTKPEGVFARVADVTRFRQIYTKPLITLEEGIQSVMTGLTVGWE